MASSSEYLEYVLDLLRETSAVTYRKMMGEFVLYSQGVVFGGIYDDRFLLKNTPESRAAFPSSVLVSPYPGAKEMITVETEDPNFIAHVVRKMLPEIPTKRARK